MKTRKVQETGRSSYILTLPKKWIQDHNIVKNQALGVLPRSNGTLLITKHTSRTIPPKIKHIQLQKESNLEYFYRELMGSYLTGFHEMQIHTEDRISIKVRESIRKFTRATKGFEVFDEKTNLMHIKDLITPGEKNFNKELNRMVLLVSSMYKDAIKAIKDNDKTLVKDLNIRDEEINSIARFIIRNMSIFLQNSTEMGESLMDLKKAQISFVISLYLELLGDNAVVVVNNISKLFDKQPPSSIIKDIEKASEAVVNLLNDAIKSWDTQDFNLANECIDRFTKIDQLCDRALNQDLEKKFSIPVVKIVENIRKTGKITANIAFLTIDNIIADDNEPEHF